MSINMSNVKAITLGGLNVKKIEDTSGNVLWKLPMDNASIITFYSYTVKFGSYSRYLNIEQLTNKVSATTKTSEAMKLVILDSQEIQNIKNKSYNQDVVLGHTLAEWQNSPDSYFLCYVLNNELYMIGNSQNPTENNTVVGTTNDLTYARHYYPFDTESYKYVNTVNNSSTGTDVVRWGTTSFSYYFINSTTSVGSRTRFKFNEIEPTVSPYIYYGKQAITSLSVSGYNTTFPLNGTFTFGGNAVVTYTDGTTKDVTEECTIIGYNLANGGKQTVKVKYSEGGLEVSTTYQITVGTEHTGTYNWAITYTTSTSTVPRLTASSSSPYYTSHVVLPSTYDMQQKIQTEKGISGVSITSVKYYQRYHGSRVTNATYEFNLRTSYVESTSSTVSSLPGSSVGTLAANQTAYMYGSINVKQYLYSGSERILYWYYTGFYSSSTLYYRVTSTSTTSGLGLSSSDSSQPTKLEIEYVYYT